MIIHNATIHSPVERFATALHVEGSTIVWMGDEDTAQYRMKSYPDVVAVDAAGLLVTPAFHNTLLPNAPTSEYHLQGLTAGHVVSPDVGDSWTAFDLTPINEGQDASSGVVRLPAGATTAQMEEFVLQPWPALSSPALCLETPADVEQFEKLTVNVPAHGRIYLNSKVNLPAQQLLGWQVVMVVDQELNFPIASLAQEGIPFSLAGEASPWELISAALFAPEGGISARAGFNALTRGAWRLTPGQLEPRGVLAVGAPADLALWQVDTLAVQAPDMDAAMWSTDQRAGTPLLPALGEEEQLPRLHSLFHQGAMVDLG